MPNYVPPEVVPLNEGHVRDALDFLVAIEPSPTPDTREAYEAATEPYRYQAAAAIATIRRFAEQSSPQSLQQMQAQYYAFTNDRRYLTTAEASAVVTDAINRAWHGIDVWRR
jgi:hypothetical protein